MNGLSRGALPPVIHLLGPAPMHPRLDFMAPLDFSNPEQFPWPMLDKRLRQRASCSGTRRRIRIAAAPGRGGWVG